jgi:hypothetical protein
MDNYRMCAARIRLLTVLLLLSLFLLGCDRFDQSTPLPTAVFSPTYVSQDNSGWVMVF